MELIKEIPKEAKLIPGYSNYYCTNNGDIISTNYGEIRLRKKHITEKGYQRICLSKGGKTKSVYVHRLVAELFIGKSDLLINHKDTNKQNNLHTNLEYATNRENVSHALLFVDKTPGVHWNKKNKKWYAQVFIGAFINQEDAISSYLNALRKLDINNRYKPKTVA
jgi:hypothetical protein